MRHNEDGLSIGDKEMSLTLSDVLPGPLVVLEEGVLFYLLDAIPPQAHLSVHSRRMTSDISAVYTWRHKATFYKICSDHALYIHTSSWQLLYSLCNMHLMLHIRGDIKKKGNSFSLLNCHVWNERVFHP